MSEEIPDKCLISGHNIAYYRKGSGQTVLLVHGITTYSFIWRNIMPELSKEYDVIAIDLLGCGDSDKPLDVEYSIKNHAEIIKGFIDELGINKFHFVGHDVGGGIGQIFAVNNTDRLIDLTVINTVAYDFWPVQPIIAMRTPIIRQFAMATLDFGALKLIVKRGMYYKDRIGSELMDYFWKPMKTKEDRKAFLHFAKCLNNQDLLEIEESLRELKLSVLIIRGDSDVYLSRSIAEKLHSELPNSKLEIIATGGHFIQEDEPKKITELIKQFFKERNFA